MLYRSFLSFLALALPVTATAQTPCTNPVQLLSVIVNPATCGNNNGTIFLNLSGTYTYNWSPNVSTNAAALSLGAGLYSVTITRMGEPACTLDTFFIVNNSDGPAVQITGTTPSNCLASNGTATLSPASLNYAWSNGELGAFNEGLNSGFYSVTATDPATNCATVLGVTIPNENPLVLTTEVTQPAKCGRPTGQVVFTVSGGSGQYSYSLGGTTVNGLPPGPGSGLVVDNASGCLATGNFTIPNSLATGTITLQANSPACADGLGNVVVNVEPGTDFKLPFTFSVLAANGQPQPSPGALSPGTYSVHVVDADSCALPNVFFEITAPPALVIQPTIQAGSCADGGSIQLNISGGTPPYLSDWTDVAGFVNPVNRLHLPAGRYSVVVYDSLFCKDTLSNLLLENNCAEPDTFHLVVKTSQNGQFCVLLPTGLLSTESNVTLQNPGITSSTLGSWNLSGNCLNYTAGSVAAFTGDIICLRVQSPIVQQDQLYCIAVHILPFEPSKESIFFTTQVEQSIVACGNLPADLNPQIILPLNVAGLSGNDAFGQYTIQNTTACIDYTAYTTIGFNVDSITIAVCDLVQQRCHQITYLPTILPFTDCSGGIIDADSLSLPTSDCITGASTCLKIPYANILNFNILDNNKPYTQGALGCNEGTVKSYAIAVLPNGLNITGGPYHLDEWFVNGQAKTGVFSNAEELNQLMNQLDPVPGWNIENFQNIIGGAAGSTYGPLRVSAPPGLLGVSNPVVKTAALGSDLRFSTGEHRLVLRKIQTGCADTVAINVNCFDCPGVHGYLEDIFGNIEWQAPACAADTLFCTNIPLTAQADWTITDNFGPISNTAACGNFLAFRFDTGYHELRLRNNVSTCNYVIRFYFDCRKAPIDTIFGQVAVGASAKMCIDTSLVPSPIISIFNICPANAAQPNATLSYDEQNWCAVVEGTVPGLDTFCLQICNADGQCATILALLEVLEAGGDRLRPYNAISPNGDGANDTWVIPGLQQYPAHEITIFNRWGNLVYAQRNYQNNWDGTWNGQLLPDGTYYYVIELGDGGKPVKGTLQVLR